MFYIFAGRKKIVFTFWKTPAYPKLILNFGSSLYILRTWKQSRFGLFRIGCHPNDADQLSLLFNHSKASLSFKVPFYQLCCMAFDFYHIAAILLRKCLTLEISVNQGMPVCAVNTAHGGENATDIFGKSYCVFRDKSAWFRDKSVYVHFGGTVIYYMILFPMRCMEYNSSTW